MRLTVRPDQEGERLDALLAGVAGSRSRAQRLIEAGQVLVDGAPARKGHKVRDGEVLDVDEVDAHAPIDLGEGPPAPHEVVWEDEHLLVVDKPAGVVVHPAAGHASGTLV
ncbi:MAG: rRNA synthase, partial [Solirubrobacteraceae bacterium]|nr:rRNA synthase [Solirubrobacteraceae bacterium]